MPKLQPKVIWDSHLDWRINLDRDPDVCWISPKMLWIYYLVGISHFTKFVNKRLSCRRVTVQRFVSLHILLSHSRSFEMTLLSRACAILY